MKYCYFAFVLLFSLNAAFNLSADDAYNTAFQADMVIIRTAYPDTEFSSSFDAGAGDWKIIVKSCGRESALYYADGRFISPEQLADKEHYRGMLYRYSPELMDPADIPPEFIERIKGFSSPESRSSAPVASTAFFDAIFDTSTAASTERHLVYMDFLGYRIRPHEKIAGRLERIEAWIQELAETEADVADFIDELGHASVYNRRTIRDTSGTSFHSMAIAIDLLPVNRSQKIIYWLWKETQETTNGC